MSSTPVEPKGRRRFFLAMAAGIGDAVSGAVSLVGARPEDAAPSPAPAAPPSAAAPQLRRRNAPPASIPDVRTQESQTSGEREHAGAEQPLQADQEAAVTDGGDRVHGRHRLMRRDR